MAYIYTILFLFCLTPAVVAQRLAVLTPDETEGSRVFASKLEAIFARKASVLDSDLARAAFAAADLKTPFNLTLDEAKRLGRSIGCEHYILLRSAVLRRSSFERQEYYEASTQVFVVETRSGRLISFLNEKHEASTAKQAGLNLDAAIDRIGATILAATKALPALAEPGGFEIAPEAESQAAKDLKFPIPFRRIKPEYTAEASLYDIAATVDIMVDLDADAKVVRTEITRWAGYGLDESVDKAVRSMNWRPAERSGKFIPMRFLVRYNFKKADDPH